MAGARTYWTVTSIDIGSAHFAVYVERVPVSVFGAWKKSGSAGTAVAPGQCVWHVVWDLRSRNRGQVADVDGLLRTRQDLRRPRPFPVRASTDADVDADADADADFAPSDSRVPWTHRHLLWNLRRHQYLWDASDQILIEKQLNCNPTAIRLETVCTTYFCLFCPAGVRVDSYPARYKTCVLGGPVGRSFKSARKTWARERALDICRQRDDLELADWFLRPLTKKDDLADAMLMVQAWKHQQKMGSEHPQHWSRQNHRGRNE